MKGPNYGNKKPPKESRTIPVRGNKTRGNGEDFGVLFKCWYCGFINKEGRSALGGSSDRSGLRHEVAPIPSATTDGAIAINRGIIAQHVLMELEGPDPIYLRPIARNSKYGTKTKLVGKFKDGRPKAIHRQYKAVSGIGCSLCGSKNWKGKY